MVLRTEENIRRYLEDLDRNFGMSPDGEPYSERAKRILDRCEGPVFIDWAVTREALGESHPIVRAMNNSLEHTFRQVA